MAPRRVDKGLPPLVEPAVAVSLAHAFRANGYVRRQNPSRIADEGWSRYKKGEEVRIVVRDEQELERIQLLLAQAGFKHGNAYAQAGRLRLPIYGRAQVERFLEMVADAGAGI